MNKSEFYNIALDKAKVAFGVTSDNQLAKIFGIADGSVSYARRRKSIPAKPLIDACVDKNVSLDWILGIKPKKVSNGEVE